MEAAAAGIEWGARPRGLEAAESALRQRRAAELSGERVVEVQSSLIRRGRAAGKEQPPFLGHCQERHASSPSLSLSFPLFLCEIMLTKPGDSRLITGD